MMALSRPAPSAGFLLNYVYLNPIYTHRKGGGREGGGERERERERRTSPSTSSLCRSHSGGECSNRHI